jgi:TolA-binding protein
LDNELGLKDEGVNDAKTYLERYADDDKAREVRFILGRLYTDLNNVGAAVRVYQEYEKIYPDDKRLPDVYYLLGYNFALFGDSEKADVYYGKITRQHDSNLYYSAQKNIIQNKLSNGKELEAAGVLFALMKDFPENDLDIDTFIWTAKKFIDAAQFADALEVIRLAELKKNQPNRSIEIAYYRSEAQRGLGNYDQAIEGYNECIALDKEEGAFTGPALIGLGLSLQGKGAAEEAIQSFEKAIQFNPEDNTVAMNARYHLAELFMQQERYEEAARMFMLVSILYEDKRFVPDALYGAAVAFHKAGKEEESKKAYSDLVKGFPAYEKIESLKKILEQK